MIEITMPRLSDTMEEGAISTWHKQPGDTVNVGDLLVEIETDKATMEYEAYEAGTLTKQLVPEGELVSIGVPIALLDDGTTTTIPEAPETAPADAPADAPVDPPSESAAPAPIKAERTDERLFASPLVRKLARENHLDLSHIQGTGPGGRIIRADTQELLDNPREWDASPTAPVAAPVSATASPASDDTASTGAPSAPASPIVDKRDSESVPLSSTRRVIARRLGESYRSIPHFFVTAAADAEKLVQLRADLNLQLIAAGRPKVSVNDLFIRASALALQAHPMVNASYVDDGPGGILMHKRINVGVAVAATTGLIVPVIVDADQKTVSQLGAEARNLVTLANDRKLTLDQMSGGTFTISNLGMLGVEQFTAIINPPESAILAVGATVPEAVVVDGEVVVHHRVRYTLSADHRIIDGALAARFLQSLTMLIENPWTIVA